MQPHCPLFVFLLGGKNVKEVENGVKFDIESLDEGELLRLRDWLLNAEKA